MFFHLTLFLWSLGYFLSLELLALNPNLTDWTSYWFSLLLVSVVALFSVYRVTKRVSGVPIPLLFSLATPTLLFLIDSRTNQHVFAVLSSLAFYSLLLGLYRLRFAPTDETARAFLYAGGMAALFLFYAACYGLYLNFTIPLSALMVTFGLGTFGVAFQMFSVVMRKNSSDILLASILLSLVMTEASLIASMWPFGYLTTAACLTLVFFFPWEALFLAAIGSLEKRRMLWRAALLLLLAALLLWSSPWRMLV
jgi:hypothetical protein